MEDIREAALAFYEAGPSEVKQLADTVFRSMDVNGDGWISIDEFQGFLMKNGYSCYNPKLFFEIDRDQNGFLDFGEFIVFFYITQARNPQPQVGQQRQLIYKDGQDKDFHKFLEKLAHLASIGSLGVGIVGLATSPACSIM
ncbi:hypothetical protein NE237_005499 [Protea cynaroides]|uniref:EF-hand domain-containing protein n=1 Tax=Protea cynaroides TaxID=273540 RepID=A0A9Q0QUC1_9MAGN|nr:hypothetical protein NE237_005499 [Protea cynaroides]